MSSDPNCTALTADPPTLKGSSGSKSNDRAYIGSAIIPFSPLDESSAAIGQQPQGEVSLFDEGDDVVSPSVVDC